MALQPGTMLGPYEVLSLIGAGGMGEVYKGRDTRLDRIVALKVLAPHLMPDFLAGTEEIRRSSWTVAPIPIVRQAEYLAAKGRTRGGGGFKDNVPQAGLR